MRAEKAPDAAQIVPRMPTESRPGAVSSLRKVRSVYVSMRSKTWAGITLLR
jgi:hypothetical protein